MNLKTQILSIIISLLYGIFLGFLYNFNYYFLYKTSLRYKILNNLLFSIDMFLIYFIIMLKINNGNVKIVFLILMFISYILIVSCTKGLRKIVKNMKSKYKYRSKKKELWYNLL